MRLWKGGGGNDTLTSNTNATTLSGGEGNDLLTAQSGADNSVLNGGEGDDTFALYQGVANLTIDGGIGGSWTDQIELLDGSGGTYLGQYGVDWTLSLSEGTIDSVNTVTGEILLSQDADGTIVIDGTDTITFSNVERIVW